MARHLLNLLLSANIRQFTRSCFVVGGLALAAYGIFLWSKPAALLFAGLSISALAVLGAPPPQDGGNAG